MWTSEDYDKYKKESSSGLWDSDYYDAYKSEGFEFDLSDWKEPEYQTEFSKPEFSQTEPEKKGWLSKALSFGKDIGVGAAKMAIRSLGIGGDIIAGRGVPTPVSAVRNQWGALKGLRDRREDESIIEAMKRGRTAEKARPLLYEKAVELTTGIEDYEVPDTEGNVFERARQVVTNPELRKGVTSAMEIPTYGAGIATKTGYKAGSGLLARMAGRTVANQPEAIINTGLELASNEENSPSIALKTWLANSVLMGVLGNISGEIKYSKLKRADKRKVKETVSKLEEVTQTKATKEDRDIIAEAFSNGVEKDVITKNVAEQVVEEVKKQSRVPITLKRGELAPRINEIKARTGNLDIKQIEDAKTKIEEGWEMDDIIDDINKPKTVEPVKKAPTKNTPTKEKEVKTTNTPQVSKTDPPIEQVSGYNSAGELLKLQREKSSIARRFDLTTSKKGIEKLMQEAERVDGLIAKLEANQVIKKQIDEPAFGFRILTDDGEFIPTKLLQDNTFSKEYEAINTKTGKIEIVRDIKIGDPSYRPARLNKIVRDSSQDDKTIQQVIDNFAKREEAHKTPKKKGKPTKKKEPKKKEVKKSKKKTKKSKKSITAQKLNETLPDKHKIDEYYEAIQLKNELNKASKEIAKDKNKALKDAYDTKKSPTSRIAKLTEFAEIAKRDNDPTTVNSIFSTVRKTATETAQGMNMLKGLYAVNPEFKFMKNVVDARLKKTTVGSKDIKKAMEEVNKKIVKKGSEIKNITKRAYKIKDAQEMLNKIMC